MDFAFLATLLDDYQWQLSLLTLASVNLIPFLIGKMLLVVPTVRAAAQENKSVFVEKMGIASYKANQRMNANWGFVFLAVIFGLIIPFCITAEAQPWWRFARDIVVILLVYDFFYYLVHRYLFHKNGFLGGPLVWVHAVHHQQRDPCRRDSSYIHPLEVALGLGLYVGTISALSLLFGDFHVLTVIATWIVFTEINLHNHDRWTAKAFPFRYLNYMSEMHHNHHAKFTGGNFATISLLYDWMFGTLDHGDGWGRRSRTDVDPAT